MRIHPILAASAAIALLSATPLHAAEKKGSVSEADRSAQKLAEWKAAQAKEGWKAKQAQLEKQKEYDQKVIEWKARQAAADRNSGQVDPAPQNKRPNPAPTPQPAAGLTGDEQQVIALANSARRRAGLGSVSADGKLSSCARDHSNDMTTRGFFSHTSPIQGKQHFTQRAARFGTSASAENIAKNGGSPAAVFQSWMDSQAHRDNILSPSATRMGVGQSGALWTMMLGN